MKIISKKRKYQPPSSRSKCSCKTPDGGPHRNSQGIEAVKFCRKNIHSKGCRDPISSSFLCKYNLTKS